MKLYTVKNVINCLLNEKFEVKVDDNTAEKAKVAIKRMIEVSKN
jgi:quinolinate synthase